MKKNELEPKRLDEFNEKLKALPIEKKAFLKWAIDNKHLSMSLSTAVKKSYNSKHISRGGKIEIKSFNAEEQNQIRAALQLYAKFINIEIEKF